MITALVTTVFVASLVGSVHCAGMCGPLMALVVAPTSGDSKPVLHSHLQLAYHFGRLLTYSLLGLAAGAAGALVDLTSTLAGLQPVAIALAGTAMVLLGLNELLKHWGIRNPTGHAPSFLQPILQRGHRVARTLAPVPRALLLGLLTTFLPCGWLYAFAVTAAGTGSPWTGALVMAVFWIGTLPVMIAVGVGVRTIMGTFAKRVPVLCALALVVVGLVSLSGRFDLVPSALAERVQAKQLESDSAVPDAASQPACCRDKSAGEAAQ